MSSQPSFPQLNGFTYQFSSIRLYVNSDVIEGVKSIDYDDELIHDKGWGTSPLPTRRTVGKYNARGKMTLYRDAADALLNSLGPNYGTVIFTVVVSYAEPSLALEATDTLVGVCIEKMMNKGQEGNTPLVVDFDLNIMSIQRGGQTMASYPAP